MQNKTYVPADFSGSLSAGAVVPSSLLTDYRSSAEGSAVMSSEKTAALSHIIPNSNFRSFFKQIKYNFVFVFSVRNDFQKSHLQKCRRLTRARCAQRARRVRIPRAAKRPRRARMFLIRPEQVWTELRSATVRPASSSSPL